MVRNGLRYPEITHIVAFLRIALRQLSFSAYSSKYSRRAFLRSCTISAELLMLSPILSAENRSL